MKKLNRKLIPAFAMLLLSAVLMSTASFAWFSANGTVDATGLSVSATAPAALWIQNGDGNWDVTAEFITKKAGISPVTDDIAGAANTAAAGENWTFHALNAAGRAMIGQDGLIGGQPVTTDTIDETVIAAADNGSNYIKQKFVLRLEGQRGADAATTETTDIKVKVTLGTAATQLDTIWKALRVAVVVPAVAGTNEFSTGGYAIFAPGTDATLSASTPLVLEDALEGDEKVLTIAAQEDVDVYVYVWYEGNDTDCTNDDSKYNVEYSVALQFYSQEIKDANT